MRHHIRSNSHRHGIMKTRKKKQIFIVAIFDSNRLSLPILFAVIKSQDRERNLHRRDRDWFYFCSASLKSYKHRREKKKQAADTWTFLIRNIKQTQV